MVATAISKKRKVRRTRADLSLRPSARRDSRRASRGAATRDAAPASRLGSPSRSVARAAPPRAAARGWRRARARTPSIASADARERRLTLRRSSTSTRSSSPTASSSPSSTKCSSASSPRMGTRAWKSDRPQCARKSSSAPRARRTCSAKRVDAFVS